ncbi:MAG: hypothetical protein ACK4ND_13015 [Cytophagaceae bacterium]
MENDPELSGKYLGTITQDFVKVAENIKEASYQIRKRDFSKFPIFPVCKAELQWANILIGRGDFENEWNYYASFMEYFIQRGLIESAEEFQQAFKDPDEYCCLFVIDMELTSFMFIPYPEE